MTQCELPPFPANQPLVAQQDWLEKYLPWTADGSPDFRPINANQSWSQLVSRQLWGGRWRQLAILMADPTINEIQVQALGTDPNKLAVLSEGPRGVLVHPDLTMSSEELLQGLGLIVSTGLSGKGVRGTRGLSQSLDQEVIINTNLDDGPRVSRLTAVVPSGSNAPACSIRRFPVSAIPEAVFVGRKSLSREVHPYAWPGESIPAAEDPLPRLLKEAESEAEEVPWASCTYRALAWVLYQFTFEKNVEVYGPTSSGKTSALQTLLSLTDHNLRTISVEKDANELFLPHVNKVSLFCTDVNKDPKRTPNLILEAILRLTPEVIINGELRGAEAFSYFDAVSSGHRGMTTVHAKTPRSCVSRTVGMAQRGAPEGTPGSDVRDFVLAATNTLVQVRRQTFLLDGKVKKIRRVSAIHEVILQEDRPVEYRPIFTTKLNSKGEPCLVYNGDPGTLVDSLREDHLPIPKWLDISTK
jgi:Flp pilus assembly CpaF family ATPase